MGLAPSADAAVRVRGTPKLVIVSSPRTAMHENDDEVPNIQVQAFSMGKTHPSLQLTGAACLGSAVWIEGTVAHRVGKAQSAWQIPSPERTPSPCSESSEGSSGLLPSQASVRIAHASGSIKVQVLATSSESFAVVDQCIVSRTARRLFEGKVYYDEASV
jgi:2-methylaconitate cis-trans-isomerase PrpF